MTRKLYQVKVQDKDPDVKDSLSDEDSILQTMGADSSFRKIILGITEDHNGGEEKE